MIINDIYSNDVFVAEKYIITANKPNLVYVTTTWSRNMLITHLNFRCWNRIDVAH